jgi:hypothetical protein
MACPDLPESRAPWDQLPNEGAKAYAAFVSYRDQGTTRSVRSLAGQIGKSRALLERWSSTYDWRNRARAWDDHLSKLRNEAWEMSVVAPADAVAEMNARHAMLARELQTKAFDALRNVLPTELSPKDILAFLVEATRLERQAVGQPEPTPEEEFTDQEVVIQLLADPDTRRMAATLATRVALPRRAATNGNGRHAGHHEP